MLWGRSNNQNVITVNYVQLLYKISEKSLKNSKNHQKTICECVNRLLRKMSIKDASVHVIVICCNVFLALQLELSQGS